MVIRSQCAHGLCQVARTPNHSVETYVACRRGCNTRYAHGGSVDIVQLSARAARLERDLISTARAMGQAIDRELLNVKTAAQVLATSPYLQKGDLSAFYDQAKSVIELRIGNNVVVTDATGQQVLNTIRPFGEQLPGHGNLAQLHLEQLREVFEKRRPVISDLFIGGVLRQPITSVDVPVLHDSQVVYELGVVILPDRFSNLLRDQNLPQGWIATVFDSSGTIAARTHEMDRFVGKKGSPELIKRMGEVSEGALPTITVEGIPVYRLSADRVFPIGRSP